MFISPFKPELFLTDMEKGNCYIIWYVNEDIFSLKDSWVFCRDMGRDIFKMQLAEWDYWHLKLTDNV